MFRDNRDKLERHEYREKQLGEQLKNALSAIDKKQTEQSVADKALEAVVKDLEQSMSTLSKSVAEEVRISNYFRFLLRKSRWSVFAQ